MLLKRLADAERDGNTVLAIVRGSATNHDGASNGITAPNGSAQEDVIRAALVDADLLGNAIGFVETHGTGTNLGDPIEVAALTRVYGKDRHAPLWLGSVKANIGHLEAAAGVAGVIKAVLALRHRVLPRQIHFDTPNPHIAWSEALVAVPCASVDWAESDRPRRAGVSAFGMSGTNVHLILEEAPPRDPAPERPELRILCLSAVEPETMCVLAADHARLIGNGTKIDLEALCYTANTGRAQLQHRVALISDTADELRIALAAVAAGQPPPPTKAEAMDPRMQVAGAFLTSAQVDWARIYGGQRHPVVELPLYPFRRDRHWFEPDAVPEQRQDPLATKDRSIIEELRSTFAKLIGVTREHLTDDASFIEAGADSLLLIDAVRAIEQSYGVRIPMPKLMQELSTLVKLAAFIEAEATRQRPLRPTCQDHRRHEPTHRRPPSRQSRRPLWRCPTPPPNRCIPT